MLKKVGVMMMATAALALSGCAATSTAIAHRNLDVQTKMSDTIFLDPVTPDQRTVLLQIRNTTDHPELVIKNKIAAALTSKGYTLTDDPSKAHYMIQANILKVGKADARESQRALNGGFGAGLAGAAVGAGAFGGGSGKVGTGLLGAAIGIAADAMVKDVYFTMITDVQISERADKGVSVTENNTATLHQGNSGAKQVSSTETTHWHRYQTRIVSTANKVNLEFPEALPSLEKGLVSSVSGLM